MIERIYTALRNFYLEIKKPIGYTFVALFICIGLMLLTYGYLTPTIIWAIKILGGSMVLFVFIMAILHILVGIRKHLKNNE